MTSVTNIAAYRFARIEDPYALRAELLPQCKRLDLKGTILLAQEGINLFLAGSAENVESLLKTLRALPGFADLHAKYSLSETTPFTHMLIKVKKEIVTFGVEGIDPAQRPSPKLTPHELKRWLDEGKKITLLDTRNDYEYEIGAFEKAIPAGINSFREFPEALKKLPEELKEQPVVIFCTGGIRCEKAGPFMVREGFKEVYQLDGGILKYFEEIGSDHYRGDCFVFDDRRGIDSKLQESEAAKNSPALSFKDPPNK